MQKVKKGRVKISTVKRLWSEFNAKVFGGVLSAPYFRITRARNYYGMYVNRDSSQYSSGAIYISGRVCDDINLTTDTLLHEMIHQWQMETAKEKGPGIINHGPSFTQWVPIIKEKTGIDLNLEFNTD